MGLPVATTSKGIGRGSAAVLPAWMKEAESNLDAGHVQPNRVIEVEEAVKWVFKR